MLSLTRFDSTKQFKNNQTLVFQLKKLTFLRITYKILNGYLVLYAFGGLFSTYSANAQKINPQAALDSIKANSSIDSIQIKSALDLVSHLENRDYDGAHYLAQWALKNSKEIEYDWGVLESYYWLANLEYELNKPEVMHEYLDSIMALSVYDTFEKILGRVYNQRGIAYYGEDDYINALRFWEKALKLTPRYESSGLLSNIGNIYLSNDKLDEALEYYLKAVEINQEQENYRFLTINYINISNCYTFKDPEQIHYLKLGVETAKKASYTRILPYYFFDIANYYSANHDFSSSYRYIDSIKVQEAEQEWTSGLALESTSNYMYHLAMYKTNGQVVNDSIPYGGKDERSLFKAARDNYQSLIQETTTQRAKVALYEYLAEIDTQLGDFKAATSHYKQAYNYKDSLSQNQSLFQLKQLEMEQEQAEKRETELLANQERQKQRNRLNMVLAGGGIILIISVGLFGRLRYINKTKRIIQKEKNRSDELLHNILPADVAAELKEKGESEARNFEEATILFTDFVAFTETAEKLSAKELVNEVNTCFRAFDQIMEKYRIEKIKTIGDAYMAAGGLHIPKISEPKDVVNAALEMQEFIVGRKIERDKLNLPAFNMRIGIHTGPVVAGIVGVKKFQYDIWGDTVNTASRMESNSEAGKVNISQTTYELLKDDTAFKFVSRGKIEAKGKGEIEMYFVSRNRST